MDNPKEQQVTTRPPEQLDQELEHLDKLDWENMDGGHLGDLLLRAQQQNQASMSQSEATSASSPPEENSTPSTR